ncbi:MAG TPA: hypothetical protein VJU87_10810 [Gemmatimonadaceae bacterium]|nr:hypothetical protein [Gemmatimonadaceae bacterium]
MHSSNFLVPYTPRPDRQRRPASAAVLQSVAVGQLHYLIETRQWTVEQWPPSVDGKSEFLAALDEDIEAWRRRLRALDCLDPGHAPEATA